MVSNVQNLYSWLDISFQGQKQIRNRFCDTVSWSIQALLLLYPCLHLSIEFISFLAIFLSPLSRLLQAYLIYYL